jgi:4-amino-4-deoxy-L-arabinose transferase-like glycosyltransferase
MMESNSSWKQRSCVLGLLTVFAVLAFCSVREKSGTFDELFHITGGYSYWTTGDYRIHNTNGNLVQRWIALPLLAMKLKFPSTDLPTWHRPVFFGFDFGRGFFFNQGNDPDKMLRYSRAMIIVLGVLLGLVVYRWSAQLFGQRGGLISLTLFAFSPTVIAHSQIATSDAATALGFTLSTWCMWKLLHRLSFATLAASCLVVGLTAVVKFSAPLLLIIGLLMVFARVVRNRRWIIRGPRQSFQIQSRWQSLALMLGLGFAHILVAAAVIWACYGFRYSGFSEFEPGRVDLIDSWSVVMKMKNRRAASIIQFCRDHQLFPEAYLHGLGHTLKFAEKRPSFLLGECRMTGWWYFHPYCYFAKTTLSTHALSLIGIGALVWRWRRYRGRGWRAGWLSLYPIVPLVALLTVYWFVSVRSHLNLGVRHVLPVYPAMFILAGATALWLRPMGRSLGAKKRNSAEVQTSARRRSPWMSWGICILLGLHVLDSLLTYPNYLAYFSPAVGGPGQGYKQLVDSNLDWGQDLPGLAKWQRENSHGPLAENPFYLSYSGSSAPFHYGIKHIAIPDFLLESVSHADLYPLRAGTYCISVTTLVAPNEPVTRWTRQHEQGLNDLIQAVLATPADELDSEHAENDRIACGYLQFDRLLAYLREREPDDHINYSMHIYYLTDQEIEAAMRGPLKEMDP